TTGCARAEDSGAGAAVIRSALKVSVQLARGLEHLGDVAGYLHLAPFPAQYAFTVDEEGAAFDALVLLAIQLLLADHVEDPAQGFVGIADQFEGEVMLGTEVLMGPQAVAGHPEDQRVGSEKL